MLSRALRVRRHAQRSPSPPPARRHLPLTLDDGLTMVMELDDVFCLACAGLDNNSHDNAVKRRQGSGGSSGPDRKREEEARVKEEKMFLQR